MDRNQYISVREPEPRSHDQSNNDVQGANGRNTRVKEVKNAEYARTEFLVEARVPVTRLCTIWMRRPWGIAEFPVDNVLNTLLDSQGCHTSSNLCDF